MLHRIQSSKFVTLIQERQMQLFLGYLITKTLFPPSGYTEIYATGSQALEPQSHMLFDEGKKS